MPRHPDSSLPIEVSHTRRHRDLGVALHEAALHGDKRKIKKLIKAGVTIDFPNSAGQTALFIACFEGHDSLVSLLLSAGANPNERCKEGCTPVHAAAYSGNTKIIERLIETGGDLRLHDEQGRTVLDWGDCQTDLKKKKKMKEFLEMARFFAMTHSGRDLLLEKQSSHYFGSLRPGEGSSSLGNLLRLRSNSKNLSLASSVKSFGFGKRTIHYHLRSLINGVRFGALLVERTSDLKVSLREHKLFTYTADRRIRPHTGPHKGN